jgi:hypothetical protein
MAVGALVKAAVAAVAVGGSALGLLLVGLPSPLRGDKLSVAVVHRLLGTRIQGAVIQLNGSVLHATCRPHRRGVSTIALSNGDRLTLKRTRFVVPPARLAGRALQYLQPVPAGILARQSAEADLAGTHQLYLQELIGRLLRGDQVVEGTATFAGRPVYRIQLGNAKPRIELLVDRRTLKPVGARFRSAQLNGSSRFRTGRGGC